MMQQLLPALTAGGGSMGIQQCKGQVYPPNPHYSSPNPCADLLYFYFIFIFIYFLVLHHQAGEKGLSGSPCEGQLMEHQHQLMLMAICGPHRL